MEYFLFYSSRGEILFILIEGVSYVPYFYPASQVYIVKWNLYPYLN